MPVRIRLTPITWFVILTVIAIGLALGLQPDPHAVHQLHTSQFAYRVAVALLLIPYCVIWYVSFYAFAKLQEYARSLEGTKDGLAFRTVAAGMGTLAFSLIVPTIIGLILNNIAVHNPSFTAASVIINNYLSLFPGMVAFLLLYNGARALKGTLRGKLRMPDLRWHAVWFILLCIVFSHLTLANHYRQNTYHLGVWPLVITYIVPYLYGWMVGLLGAYDFYVYAKTVRGKLYQIAVRQFAYGITIGIIGSIAIQFVNITLAQRLGNSLVAILLGDYALLIVVGVGLVLMALGTKKLKRIEEL